MGNLFEKSQEGKTKLTARVFKGNTEVENLTYTWYINDELIENENEKTIELDIQRLINATVYFTAVEQTPAS